MNKIIIIGGGLTGLSCAIKLIENNIDPSNIEIFEARQEIGSPTRSPGIAKNSDNTQFLFNKIKLQPLTSEHYENNLISFRREWLEKSLLIHLTKLGCKINLKRKITEKEIVKLFNDNIKKTIINCAGNKKKSSGFPGDYTDFINSKNKLINSENFKCVKWYGYLSTTINEFKLEEKFISINKKDGLNETWICENKINPKNKVIEMMKSTFPPNSELILANNTIDRGFSLANKAIKQSGVMS